MYIYASKKVFAKSTKKADFLNLESGNLYDKKGNNLSTKDLEGGYTRKIKPKSGEGITMIYFDPDASYTDSVSGNTYNSTEILRHEIIAHGLPYMNIDLAKTLGFKRGKFDSAHSIRDVNRTRTDKSTYRADTFHPGKAENSIGVRRTYEQDRQ